MEMQIPYCICPKVYKTGNIRENKARYRRNINNDQKKKVEILAAEECNDHIYMYVSLPPKMNVSGVVGYLKRKSTLIIFKRHGNINMATAIFV